MTDFNGQFCAMIQQDLESTPPLPEPAQKKKKYHLVQSLMHWMLYFLLIWQSITHLSDNGLTWLLQFLFQFLKVLNVQVSNELLTEMITIFPCSLYILQNMWFALNAQNVTYTAVGHFLDNWVEAKTRKYIPHTQDSFVFLEYLGYGAHSALVALERTEMS